MEPVREGRRERQPGLVHDNDNVRAPIFQRHEASAEQKTLVFTSTVTGRLPVQG